MKVRVLPDGTMEFDATPVEAMELVQAQQQKTASEQAAKVTAERASVTADLSGLLYRTWEFLVENDRAEGVHLSAVSRAFGCADTASSARLQELLKQGHIKRVRRGYYRAVDGGGEING